MLTASARLPERARLAGAIERHRDAAEQLARVEAAIDKIKATRIEDRVAISRARDALRVAQFGRSEILISQTLGEPVPADLPDPAEAKAVLDDCEARLDAGTQALRTLDAEAQRARSALDLAEGPLKRAIAEVVSTDPKLATLRDEFERTMASAARLWRSLRSAGVFGIVHIVERVPGDDPEMLAVLARLRGDADAEFPSLPPDMPSDHARPGGRRAA